MATTEKLYTIGSEGDDILDLQALLGVTESGVYDDATKNAVTQYQTQNGLTVDGVVGDETLSSLLGSGASTTPETSQLQPTMVSPVPDTTAQPTTQLAATPAISPQSALSITLPGISDATRQALSEMLSTGYTPSATVEAALKELNDIMENEPADFSSKWSTQIDAIMDKIMNRDAFSYDFSTDPTYNTYKDIYQRQGRMSMMDTVGQSSALTGGYGNSWAQTAGQQAYNQSLQSLNNIVPELQAQALTQYNAEGQRLQDAYGLMSNERAQDLGEYQQGYNEWANSRDFAQGQYATKQQYDYNDYASRAAYLQSLAQQENSQYNANKEYAYNTAMSMLQSGLMPSDEMLVAAGLSKADAKAIKKANTRSSGRSSSSRSSGYGTSSAPTASSTPSTLTADQLRAKLAASSNNSSSVMAGMDASGVAASQRQAPKTSSASSTTYANMSAAQKAAYLDSLRKRGLIK